MKTALYIHWPFCAAKCPYCDFNSYAGQTVDHGAWGTAYVRALEHYARLLPEAVISTIYFGGGTPSLMQPAVVENILETARRLWRMANDVEITLEANPTSIENAKMQDFASAGINRVSVGVQALNDADLKFLGREHSAKDALQALDIAAQNFNRFSFDLIYARPQQDLQSWERELHRALAYARGHMSLYQLTVERSTPFFMDHAQGKFKLPDDKLAADFYVLTQDIMAQAGLPAYEVSNHAAAGDESRHNLAYWHYDDYIGIGPGAHGRITLDGIKHAVREHRVPSIWMDKVSGDGCGAHPFAALSAEDAVTEAIMVGLRLREGISLRDIMKKCALDVSPEHIIRLDRLPQLISEGWMKDDAGRLSLTTQGTLRLNMIIAFLLAA